MKFLPSIQKSFVDVAGIPLDGGKILVLKSGSTDHADLYADAEGTSFAKNPYTLDVSGSFKFFVDADMDLDYFVYDEGGALAYSYYNIKVNPCDYEGGGSGPSGDVEWDDVKNKPSAFPPSAHRHNASEIDNLPEVPTKTSQLENDSGFITSEDIPAVPTKTSELENDSGFLSTTDSFEKVEYLPESGLNYPIMNLFVRHGMLYINGTISKSGTFEVNKVTNVFRLKNYKAVFDFRNYYGTSGYDDVLIPCALAVLGNSNQFYIYNTLNGAKSFYFNIVIPVIKIS